jgi:hypothetical protein
LSPADEIVVSKENPYSRQVLCYELSGGLRDWADHIEKEGQPTPTGTKIMVEPNVYDDAEMVFALRQVAEHIDRFA